MASWWVVGLAVVLGGCGCQGEPGAGGGAGGSAGAGGTAATSSTTTTTHSSTTTATCSPQQLPEYVPAGWEEYTDWSCDCRAYVPGSAAVMPQAIEWVPCPESPGGMDCRMMANDWPDSSGGVTVRPRLDVSPQGTVLAFGRLSLPAYATNVVALVDGPVLSAIIFPSYQGCYYIVGGGGEGMKVVKVRGAHGLHPEPSRDIGALGGAIDELRPGLLARYEDEDNQGWACGAQWVVKETSAFVLSAFPWDMSTEHVITSPAIDPEGTHAVDLLVRGDAVFWETDSSRRAGIMVWTEPGGTKEFVRWVGDPTRGAGSFGTDGTDMVWLQGEGKEPSSSHYPGLDVMTAPFTSDPAAIQPRRLRSHNYSAMTGSFKVGCGYAVGLGAGIVALVRLSDGQAWYLPESAQQEFGIPVGVTCDDVFAAGNINGDLNVARIRIDSLGPGVPAD